MSKPFVRLLARLTLAGLTCAALVSPSLACSIRLPEYRKFDANEYVFYGEVIDYVAADGAYCGGNLERDQCGAWGWKLSVLDVVSMPKPGLKQVELFTFGLGPDCSMPGRSRASAEKTPIGTRLMVVAKNWYRNPDAGVTRLDGSGYTGALILPLPDGADPARLRMEETDYASDRHIREVYGWMDFELRKEMARLEGAPDFASRKRVLERMAKMPPYYSNDLYRELLRRYMRDAPTARALLKSSERGPGEFRPGSQRRYLHDESTLIRYNSPQDLFNQGMYAWTAIPLDAVPLFQRAARGGFVAADLMLGRVYEELRASAPPKEREQYRRLAQAAFKRAALRGKAQADRGNPFAQLMLATTPEELRPWIPPLPQRIQEDLQCAVMPGSTRAYHAALGISRYCPQGI
jgi:hypothetical protein